LEEKNECVSGVCVCVVLNSRRGEEEEEKKKCWRKERKKMCCAVPCPLWPVERKRRGPAGREGKRDLHSSSSFSNGVEGEGDQRRRLTRVSGYSFFFLLFYFVAQVQFWDGGDGRSWRGTRISKWPLGFKE
jgi:hypothetical protein